MTLVERYQTAFTGTQTGPRIFSGIGVAGAAHDFLAEALTGADGDLIMSVPDQITAMTPTPKFLVPASGTALGTSANAPTLQTVSGERVIRFDGADDGLIALTADFSVANFKTVVVVCRTRTAPGAGTNIFRAGGNLQRNVINGALTLTKNNASNVNPKTLVAGGTPDLDINTAGFKVVTVSAGGYNGGGNFLAINGTFAGPMTLAGETTKGNELPLLIGIGSQLDVLRATVFPTIFTEADTDAMYTAMRIRYPVLVP